MRLVVGPVQELCWAISMVSIDTERYKEVLKGTTTVGLVCSDGIVLGVDSRATMDTFIASKEAKKVFKIDDNLGVTVAGLVGDAQEIVRILKVQNEIYKMAENKPLSPKSATSLLSIILQQNKMTPFYVQLIVGGMDDGKGQLYSVDPVGSVISETAYTSTGSGSLGVMGYLEDAYKKELAVKDGIKLAAKAVSIAIQRDSATGNNITVVTITKEGYKEYTGKELERYTLK